MQFDQPLGPFVRSTDEGSVMAKGSLLGGRGGAGATRRPPCASVSLQGQACSKDWQLLVAGLSPCPGPLSGARHPGGLVLVEARGVRLGWRASGLRVQIPSPCSGARGLGRVPGWALGLGGGAVGVNTELSGCEPQFLLWKGFPGELVVRKPPVSAGDVGM